MNGHIYDCGRAYDLLVARAGFCMLTGLEKTSISGTAVKKLDLDNFAKAMEIAFDTGIKFIVAHKHKLDRDLLYNDGKQHYYSSLMPGVIEDVIIKPTCKILDDYMKK